MTEFFLQGHRELRARHVGADSLLFRTWLPGDTVASLPVPWVRKLLFCIDDPFTSDAEHLSRAHTQTLSCCTSAQLVFRSAPLLSFCDYFSNMYNVDFPHMSVFPFPAVLGIKLFGTFALSCIPSLLKTLFYCRLSVQFINIFLDIFCLV